MAAKSLMSRRYTLHLTTLASDEPGASRIVLRLSNTRVVSERASPRSTWPVAGLMHPCPETKTKPFSTMACEYGPIGFGALSVWTGFLISRQSPRLPHRRQRAVPRWPECRLHVRLPIPTKEPSDETFTSRASVHARHRGRGQRAGGRRGGESIAATAPGRSCRLHASRPRRESLRPAGARSSLRRGPSGAARQRLRRFQRPADGGLPGDEARARQACPGGRGCRVSAAPREGQCRLRRQAALQRARGDEDPPVR